MGVLKGIATLLNKPEKEKDDKAIIEAFNKQGEKFDKIAEAIQKQPKPEKPEVNITTDNKELLPLLRDIKDGYLELKKAIEKASENKPMVDEFKIENSGNWSKTIKVIYKPANQITIKK
jgi:hypothetical protein